MSDLRRALALFNSKQYAAALPQLQAALLQSEQKPGGPTSAATAGILFNIGYCCQQQSDYRIAAEYYRRAAAISNYGVEHRFLASLNAAKAFLRVSVYAEAENQLNSSLSMIDAESAAGTTAPTLLKVHRAEVLALSANILVATGRYSETLPRYEENLAYYESIGDTEHMIDCLIGLGTVYFHQGLPDKALAMGQNAHSLCPRSAESLVNLSSLLSNVNLLDEALECAQKALACEERENGKNTANYITFLLQIGSGYLKLDQPDVALSWYHQARAGFEKLKLTTTVHFGLLLNSIGAAYLCTNRLKEALAYYTRAESVYHGVLPPDHPSITACMRDIATANAALGNTDAADAAAAAAASSARRSQVQCAAAGCPRKLKADGTPLDQCGGCKRCYYCSKACQTADWKSGHKAECKTLSGET